MLNVGPVVRKWLEDVIKPKNICPAQVASLLLCIVVMGLLLRVSTGCISPGVLAEAISKHYAAHAIAYGYTLFVPKHHFLLHLPGQLARFKFLVSCWVHERKHKIANGGPSRCALPGRGVTIELCSKNAPWHT